MCLAIVNFACRMLVGAIGGGGGRKVHDTFIFQMKEEDAKCLPDMYGTFCRWRIV